MTKDEFLYDHDLDLIVDLINREVEFMNGENEGQPQKSNKTVRATDFL